MHATNFASSLDLEKSVAFDRGERTRSARTQIFGHEVSYKRTQKNV
jgi:hypothetical protein